MKDDKLKTPDQLYYILDSHISKKWIGYMSIKLDLQFVKQILDVLSATSDEYDETRELINKSNWISSVVIYGKCFTDASKGRRVKLEGEVILKENKNLLKLHTELMSMRHNYVAHAGNTAFEVLEPRIQLATSGGDTFYAHLVYQGQILTGFNIDVTEKFIELIDFLLDWVDSKSKNLGSKILQIEEEEKSKEVMLRLMKEQRDRDLK